MGLADLAWLGLADSDGLGGLAALANISWFYLA